MEKRHLNWVLYVVECSDESLYCGITNNLNRRIEQHNSGKGAKYTRSRKPVRLRANWDNLSHGDAARLEVFFKRFNRSQKLKVMMNPNWSSEYLMRLEKHSADDSSNGSKE